MVGKEYLYCLKDSLGRFYGLNSNFEFVVNTNPYFLKNNPDGHNDISIKNQRNKRYFGLDRSVTVPLAFVGDGAEILKNIFYRFGIEADVILCILEQRLYVSDTEYGFWYKQIFEGEPDFSTWKDTDPKVTVNVLEQGAVKYIKANESTVQELSFDVPEAIVLKNDGVSIKQNAKFFISNGSLPNDFGHHTIDMTVNNSEEISGTLGSTTQERVQTPNNSQALWDTGQRFHETGAAPQEYIISWDFKMTPQLVGVGAIFGTTILLKLVILEDRDNDTRFDIDAKGGGDPLLLYNVEQHFQGSVTMTIPANRRLVLVMAANANSTFTSFTYNLEGGTFDLDYFYRYPQTLEKVLRPGYVFKKIIENVTEGKFDVDVSGLLTLEQNKVYSSGLNVRAAENAILKITLVDFFEFWDTYKDVGMVLTSDRKLKIDLKKNLISSNVTELGEIAELSVSTANDFLINVIKIGYTDKEIDEVNGRQSFNNTFEWSLGTTRAPKELDKVCKTVTDCYAIEKTRLRYTEKQTTDSKGDNDIIVYHIEDAADINNQFALNREINPTIEGLIETESVYNVELSPKRCLENNFGYLAGCLDLMTGRIIKFKTASKNNEVQSGVPLLIEKEDVPVNGLGDKYFRPYYFEFRTKGVQDLLDKLDEDSLRLFTFTYKGTTYKGIPESVGIEPRSGKSQVYKLLCSGDTDLKKLIEYYG